MQESKITEIEAPDFPPGFIFGPLQDMTTKKLVELKILIETILESRVKAQK